MNTLITIIAFLVSLTIQIAVLAYYAGKFSQMVQVLTKDLEDHKKDSIAKHTEIRTELAVLAKEKAEEHGEFRTDIATTKQMMVSFEETIRELKDSMKELSKVLQELLKKR